MNREDKAIFASILHSQTALTKASEEKERQQLEALTKIKTLIKSKEEMIKSWDKIEELDHFLFQACALDYEQKLPKVLDDLRFWLLIAPESRVIDDLWMRLKHEVGESYDRNSKRLNNVMINADKVNIQLLDKSARIKADGERLREMERQGDDYDDEDEGDD